MRIVSFGPRGAERAGLLLDEKILDLAKVDPSLPKTVRAVLEADLLGRIEEIARSRDKLPGDAYVPIEGTRLGPPITDPSKIICLGLNYADHAREQGKQVPDWPLLFAKAPSCLVGDREPIPVPPGVTQLDHEVELAFVIAKRAKDVPMGSAFDHIAGYSIFIDMSARDVQFREKQWFRGKSFDGFGPFGPCLVTKGEIPDPHDLSISLEVDGEKRQESNTSNMHFKVDYLVYYISRSMTLEPGDIIATGTPAGVGVFASPPRFLEKGQVLRASIERVGTLTNWIT